MTNLEPLSCTNLFGNTLAFPINQHNKLILVTLDFIQETEIYIFFRHIWFISRIKTSLTVNFMITSPLQSTPGYTTVKWFYVRTGKKRKHYEVFTLGLATILVYWLVMVGMVVTAYVNFNYYEKTKIESTS